MRTLSYLRRNLLCALCIILFTFHSIHPVLTTPSFDDSGIISRAGTPVRVEVIADVSTLSADEVTMFSAELYDSVNNLASGVGCVE